MARPTYKPGDRVWVMYPLKLPVINGIATIRSEPGAAFRGAPPGCIYLIELPDGREQAFHDMFIDPFRTAVLQRRRNSLLTKE